MCFDVSIHASVKDATLWLILQLPLCSFNPRICKRCDSRRKSFNTFVRGFNPRICKRCDYGSIFPKYIVPCFNPRICKRCDLKAMWGWWGTTLVSIHASVKDATRGCIADRNRRVVSIHASVKDATRQFRHGAQFVGFNPRICKRCDNVTVKLPFKQLGFNPRICKRCDALGLDPTQYEYVSIHASVKDATPSLLRPIGNRRVSIHASVKDATCYRKMRPRIAWVSIHASVKDATPHTLMKTTKIGVSIHASVKDATTNGLPGRVPLLFQSTHL